MKPKVVLRPVVHVRHVRVSHARASMIVADVCFVGAIVVSSSSPAKGRVRATENAGAEPSGILFNDPDAAHAVSARRCSAGGALDVAG